MPDKARLLAEIENAIEAITPYWPLKTFIATNPLAGFEDLPFEEAVRTADNLFGAATLPDRETGRNSLAKGFIDPEILQYILKDAEQENLYETMLTPEASDSKAPLTKNADKAESRKINESNRVFIKYLSAFLDEGQASWSMPFRESGLYQAFRKLAPHDRALKKTAILSDLPDTAMEAILTLTAQRLGADSSSEDREALFRSQFARLPGWAGFVRWRAQQKNYPWQQAHPVSLSDYLAVSLILDTAIGHPVAIPSKVSNKTPDENASQEGLLWLTAWEETYRRPLLERLSSNLKPPQKKQTQTQTQAQTQAQLIFCIDVRSEVFRRHLERVGPYETLGFAGFFGVPIRYTAFGEQIAADSCPVLLAPQFNITETPCDHHKSRASNHLSVKRTLSGLGEMLATLKKDLAATFATVEGTGALFGGAMTLKTFLPKASHRLWHAFKSTVCPQVDLQPTVTRDEDTAYGLSLSEQIFYAEASLKIMGLTKNFAPLVVLCGHGSQTLNNPYAAGLDCGACGGNHGGPNARVMATIYNDPNVRTGLRERGIDIPDPTTFLAAQHNTTTDEVTLFEVENADSQMAKTLQQDLEAARRTAVLERSQRLPTNAKPDHRATDWAEVRPEWGLARNAAFIVGPRSLTQSLDLEGRTFLHSYDWQQDTDGKALEIILTAPMVVAQWINSQYLFSTLDNAAYGSGSKITQNVVGKVGVMQGNASDLMTGLPLQSLTSADGELYHEPLRLLTIVHAPRERLKELIDRHDILKRLFHNGWVALSALDPEDGILYRYTRTGTWKSEAHEENLNNLTTA